jgi:hypothetical protein
MLSNGRLTLPLDPTSSDIAYAGNVYHVGKIGRRSGVVVRPHIPTSLDMKVCHYIEGGSLCRVSMVGACMALFKQPSASQRRVQCDRCPGQHSSRNLHCTGNFPGVPSPFRDPGHLYAIHSGRLAGTMSCDEILQRGRKVTLARVNFIKT